MKRAKIPLLTQASEYQGQRAIAVACTQLGTEYTASRAKRIVDDWVEFLSRRTELTGLEFSTRTPKRLFAALVGQPQLESLTVKWGDYADLSPIGTMRGLRHLELRGASGVTDLRALATLDKLQLLALEGFRSIEDPSPLAILRGLTDLELGGAWMTPRNGHIASLQFLRELHRLKKLLLHTLVVDDLDFSPLLDMPSLRSVRVMKVPGMRPGTTSYDVGSHGPREMRDALLLAGTREVEGVAVEVWGVRPGRATDRIAEQVGRPKRVSRLHRHPRWCGGTRSVHCGGGTCGSRTRAWGRSRRA